jgi:hypothetical protein
MRTIVMSSPASAELTPECWAAQSDMTNLFQHVRIATLSGSGPSEANPLELSLVENIPLKAQFALEQLVECVAVRATTECQMRF